MIDITKKYTYNGKPVRIYADGSDTYNGSLHGALQGSCGKWNMFIFQEADLVEVWQPSEPIYEWQCLYRPYISKEYKILADNNGFFTEGEMMRWKAEHGDNWCIKPIEETKRERK